MRHLALAILFACPVLASASTYRVSFSSPTFARVDAVIPVRDAKLWMAGWGADLNPNGWAAYIRDLSVTDASGKAIAASPAEKEWTLDRAEGRVHVRYGVDLSFTKSKWPYGNEQAGISDGSALFVVSKAIFIVSDPVADSEVTFDMPADWKVSAPWTPRSDRTFDVASRDQLINNSFVVGRYTDHVFRERGFTLTVALLGRARHASTLVADVLRKSLRSYLEIFPDTPRSSYLITLFYGEEADAEAFANSAAFTERDRLTQRNVIRWGNTIAHELFHAWNGAAIRSSDYAGTQWLSEGFTEFFANRALRREDVITDAIFRSKMEKILGLYFYFRVSPAFNGVSLRDAGAKKGPYRLGVYDGGWAVAFCLDDAIRSASRGKRNLITFMRAMYARFGIPHKDYAYDGVVNVASEVAGRDMHEWFAKYVAGTEMLPVLDALHRAGYEGYTQFYDGELYIVPESHGR